MSNLLYVGIAVVLSLLGWLMMWLRHRHPTSTEASVREFARELDALAPPTPRGPSGPTERGGQGPSGPTERGSQGPSGPTERGSRDRRDRAEREQDRGRRSG